MELETKSLGNLLTVVGPPDRSDLTPNDRGCRSRVTALGELSGALIAGNLEVSCVSKNYTRQPGHPGMLVSRVLLRYLDEEFADISFPDDGSPHLCAAPRRLKPSGTVGELLVAHPKHLGKFGFGQDHAWLSLMRSCRQNAIASSLNKDGTKHGTLDG